MRKSIYASLISRDGGREAEREKEEGERGGEGEGVAADNYPRVEYRKSAIRKARVR